MDASLLFFILGSIALVSCIRTHVRGEFLGGPYGQRITRARNPVEFWTAQVFLGLIAAGLLAVPFVLWSGLLGWFIERQ